MNPIQLSQQIQSILVHYLLTIFDVNRDGQEAELAAALKERLSHPQALTNGPFLELTPPYRTGCSLRDLCDEGVLTPALLDLPCFRHGQPIPPDVPLYVHQERAIRRLCAEKRGVVISSGTGSGKTEAFLIPILDDLLRDPAPGVRALLIYPMNALVNDQLDRLRCVLKDTEITFGRYTSELRSTQKEALQQLRDPLPNEVISREEIRSGRKLPQILITNYAMLEYLLLRPQDSPLFQSGRWHFVVLDEAHTYAGAQGIEVAMLLRRLKQRLGKKRGEMRCIATSATLTDDDPGAAVAFAQNLFGEEFVQDDIILGEIVHEFVPAQPYLHVVEPSTYCDERLAGLLDTLRDESHAELGPLARELHALGLIPAHVASQGDRYSSAAAFLYDALKSNADLTRLRQWMLERMDEPVPVEEAAAYVFGSLDGEKRLDALYRLIELGSMARPAPDKTSLLPARYHLFARSPQGIWVCLNPHCPGRDSSEGASWSRLFSERRERCDVCGCLVYPLYVCRECGQVYIRTQEDELGRFVPETKELFVDSPVHYFTWRSIVENRALASTEEAEEEELPERRTFPSAFAFPPKEICLSCGSSRPCSCQNRVPFTLYGVHLVRNDRRGQRTEPVNKMNECPRCRSQAVPETEIATAIAVSGLTPPSILAYELYRALPSASKAEIRQKPGEGRKLLTFYDSRQGAARFAAFMQDVVNQQSYRHIIPLAVTQLSEENGWWPDLEAVSQRSTELAWEYQIFHNDPDTEEWRKTQKYLSRDQRARLTQKVQTQIIAEFSTRRVDRQSLEALGLVGISYFEAGSEPDFTPLAREIGLSAEQAQTLVEYLLDDLRSKKLIVLPRGVQYDDPVFGRNKFCPHLIREGKPGLHEQPWIGATPRQRRRQYVQLVLQANRLPADDETVRATLNTLWQWLQENDLLEGKPSDGYRLRNDRLFFRTDCIWYRCERCQRLHYRGDSLPCPQPNCGGTLRVVAEPTALRDNFFFWTFDRPLVPMRIEEHTAQLDSEKGREYQDKFRDGDINVLSCSTTFEMGIDLGDLQAVVMNNVPPTVANYRQRAGRAGRRTSGTAFILTWAGDRPHDQVYFRAPDEIIRGRVRVPYLALNNPIIRQRHVYAILLSLFLRHRMKEGFQNLDSVGAFFDSDVMKGNAHFQALTRWLDWDHDEICTQLAVFGEALGVNDAVVIEGWIEAYRTALEEAYTGHYRVAADYYLQQIESAQLDRRARKEARNREERYEKLLDRLRKEELIDYLSNRGVLPSYSFPLHTVELMLPYESRTEHLRLQRDLSDAIREYAPGSEVVADKRIWRSGSVVFFRDTVRDREYRICEICNYLQISPEAGIPLTDQTTECPVCHSTPSKRRREVSRFVIPDGFRADPKKSGQPAKQYVRVEPNLMRSALIPGRALREEVLGPHVYYAYERDGELLYVNEGVFGRGFEIPLVGGLAEIVSDVRPVRVSLGHIQRTDNLHLRFMGSSSLKVPPPDDFSFWLSLMYALIQGASHALQIERRDIDGVLYPRLEDGGWGQSVVLYDDVPGGAGHVQQIRDNFYLVLHEANRTVHCQDCGPETSCYHCLRDYSNQTYHPLLKRGPVADFLDTLLAVWKKVR